MFLLFIYLLGHQAVGCYGSHSYPHFNFNIGYHFIVATHQRIVTIFGYICHYLCASASDDGLFDSTKF